MGAAGRRPSHGVPERRPAALHHALTGQFGVPPLGFEGKTWAEQVCALLSVCRNSLQVVLEALEHVLGTIKT